MRHQVEVDLVGALQLNGLAREDEVRCGGRGTRGDLGGLRVDADLDVVGDVLDGGGVGRDKVRLCADKRGDDALEEDLGVDERHCAQRGVGGILPVVVVDDKELQCVIGDRHLEKRARPVLAGGVGVLEQGGDRYVDGVGSRVDDADDVLYALLLFLNK